MYSREVIVYIQKTVVAEDAEMIDNELTRLIRNRRSIRKYRKDQLNDEQLQTLLECGFLAPSGGNSQNWHVTVVQSADYLKRLSDANRDSMLADRDLPQAIKDRFSDSGYSVSFGAPTVFFISAKGSDVNACFLAEHIVLTAESLGLGSCYLGGIMRFLNADAGRTLREELDVPEGYELLFGIAVGTPDEEPEAKPRDYTKVNYIR